jgi:ABC-2 type transport system permease protein
MRAFLRAAEATLWEILTTRELLSLAIVSVLFYAFYYPAPYSRQAAVAVPLVVVDADDSALSRAVVRRLDQTEAVRVVAHVPSIAAARVVVEERRAEGMLVLSRGLSSALQTQRPGAGIALVVNASYFVRAETIAKALAEVSAGVARDLGLARGLRETAVPIKVQALFNTTGGYRDYVFPAVANVILQQTLMFTAARLAAERRRRGHRWGGPAGALGTWAGLVLVGLLAGAFVFGFAYWLQDVPRGGNTVGLLLALPLFAAAVAALGLLLGSCFRNGDDALKLLMPTSVPLVFLAGFAWPLSAMPGWLAALAWLSPATAAMHLFIRFNQMGASLTEAATPLAVMALLALGYGVAWLWRGSRMRVTPA